MTLEESLQRAIANSVARVPERAKNLFPPFIQTCEPDEVVESLCPEGGVEVLIATNKRLVEVTGGVFKPRVKAWSWTSMSRFSVRKELWVKIFSIRVAGLDVELRKYGAAARWLREQLEQRGVPEEAR